MHTDTVEKERNAGCHRDPDQFAVAGKTPDTPVQPQEVKHCQAEQNINRHKSDIGSYVISGNKRKFPIEAQPQSNVKGDQDRAYIIKRQKNGNFLPMLQFKLPGFIFFHSHNIQMTPWDWGMS